MKFCSYGTHHPEWHRPDRSLKGNDVKQDKGRPGFFLRRAEQQRFRDKDHIVASCGLKSQGKVRLYGIPLLEHPYEDNS